MQTEWTERINRLVGQEQDFFIHKDHPDVKPFIEYLYSNEDEPPTDMREHGTDLFTKYTRVLYKICNYIKPRVVLECGIREARSSSAFTRVVSELDPPGRVYGFDPVLVSEHLVDLDYQHYWEPYAMTGEEGYKKYKDAIPGIDLLYIDVDPHHYEPTNSLVNGYWINKLKKPGYLLLDDVAPHFDLSVAHIEYSGLWRPVRDYETMRVMLEFLDKNYDSIDYCFTVYNHHANGFAIIKIKG